MISISAIQSLPLGRSFESEQPDLSIFSSFSLIRRYFIDFRIFYSFLPRSELFRAIFRFEVEKSLKVFKASTKKKKEETIEGRLAIAPL